MHRGITKRGQQQRLWHCEWGARSACFPIGPSFALHVAVDQQQQVFALLSGEASPIGLLLVPVLTSKRLLYGRHIQPPFRRTAVVRRKVLFP